MTRVAPETRATPLGNDRQTWFDDTPQAAGGASGAAAAAASAGASAGTERAVPAGGGGRAAPDVAQPAVARSAAQHAPNTSALCAELTRWEGSQRHMYVDTRGHVTTGIGHLLRDANAAAALPWLHRATGAPASPAEIRAAFQRVAAQPKGMAAAAYAPASDLVLPKNVARNLAAARLEREFLPGLRRLCAGFDSYPQPAQRALVDMAYNLGVGGLGKFTQLIGACERGDFTAAAEHCHRRTSRDERNDATRSLFLAAALLTTAVSVSLVLNQVRP